MMKKYRLAPDGRTPIVCEDTIERAEDFENRPDPHIEDGDTMIGDVRVSTVFLSLDHNWGHGPPLLWETMVFGGELDGKCFRYASYDGPEGAVQGHAAMCACVRETQVEPFTGRRRVTLDGRLID
jgi:hypothetical protein